MADDTRKVRVEEQLKIKIGRFKKYLSALIVQRMFPLPKRKIICGVNEYIYFKLIVYWYSTFGKSSEIGVVFTDKEKKKKNTFDTVKKSRYLCELKANRKMVFFSLLKLCSYEYCLYNALYTRTIFFSFENVKLIIIYCVQYVENTVCSYFIVQTSQRKKRNK